MFRQPGALQRLADRFHCFDVTPDQKIHANVAAKLDASEDRPRRARINANCGMGEAGSGLLFRVGRMDRRIPSIKTLSRIHSIKTTDRVHETHVKHEREAG